MSSQVLKILFHIQNKLSIHQLKMIFEQKDNNSEYLNYYLFSCEGVDNLKNQELENWLKHNSNIFVFNNQERNILELKFDIQEIQIDKMVELIEESNKIISF